MNRHTFTFIFALLATLISQAVQNTSDDSFETVHSYSFDEIEHGEVATFFRGYNWLENKMASNAVDLNNLYQDKAFSRSLPDKSHTKRYQHSYATWIEEKVCPESPFIDKPVRTSMSSRYGYRVHPLSGRRHIHAGIDFRGGTGTPVLAASAGIVKTARRKGAYGKAITIDHGNSFTTLYGHLSDYAIKEGQWVNLGQTIGYVGRTGRATGPHLHFEIRCHNVPLNPRKYLGKMGQMAEVKFKKRVRSFVGRPRQQRKAAAVVRDPNYYTRMINLQKLEKLKNGKKF